jgi:hypothetical protein
MLFLYDLPDSEDAVVQEANTIGELARDLSIFDSAQSREARRMLRDYADMVVKVEWRDMQRGQANAEVWTAFDRMFLTVGTGEESIGSGPVQLAIDNMQRWDTGIVKPAVENTSHER